MLQGVCRSVRLTSRETLRRTMSTLSCPPEKLLREAIRRPAPQTVSTRDCSGAATYRSAQVTELGKPLEIRNLPRVADIPKGSVRVGIQHAAVNFADILIGQGKYQEKPPLPHTLGSELAGVVTELGPEVSGLKVGDRVFGLSPGAFSEEAVVPTESLLNIPDGMTTDVACSMLIVYSTAMMALKRRANIKEGDTVLVTSAAGGMGLSSVDLAANFFKANVIGACSTDEKCQVAASRGAKHTINYTKESVGKRVKELTGGKGADIIVDNVGGDMFKECLKSVAFEGRILVIGFTSGEIPKIPANQLLVKSCSAVGVYWGSYRTRNPRAFLESIRGVMDAHVAGKISPHVCHVYPLRDVNEAFKLVMERKSTGKVVLDCTARG